MKKWPLFFLIITFLSCSRSTEECIPKLSHVNVIDHQGMSETFSSQDRLKQFEEINFSQSQPYQKALRIYERDSNGNIKAIVTSYYPNGTIKQYLEILNNRAFGVYREWFSDGVLKVEAHIIGGNPDLGPSAEKTWLFDGICKAWDEKGNLEAEIFYCKGELEGVSSYYHKNGNLWKRVPFQKNAIQGCYEIYLSDGSLLQTTSYQKNKKHGLSKRFWNNQSLAAEEYFEEDDLIEGKYFDLSGALVSSVVNGNGFQALFGKEQVNELHEIQDGKFEGEVKVFQTNGELKCIYHVKENLKHGEEVVFQPKRRSQDIIPQITIDWYEGKIHGIVRTWYNNGVMESQKEMSQNNRNGLSTAWYQDGSLMLVEEYEQDKLIKGDYFKKGERIPSSYVHEGSGVASLFDKDGHFLRKIIYHNGKPTIEN
ncbi:MORN repeat variant [Candidatus Rubidus massiliensis]|nr:MAG: hypothetical protein BGO10_02620 [Chlamydia sp. 32-24]CDZ79857.1 MORN repeat variant [Candidatus Rubidus massiliensis]